MASARSRDLYRQSRHQCTRRCALYLSDHLHEVGEMNKVSPEKPNPADSPLANPTANDRDPVAADLHVTSCSVWQ